MELSLEKSFQRSEFDGKPEYMMHTVHIWVWRIKKDNIEVLVQKRSLAKKTHPGKFDISVAGHIDANESPLIAAWREYEEELRQQAKYR